MEYKLSEQIKVQTQSHHQALEKEVNLHLKALSGPEDYARLLSCFFAYFKSMETLLADFISPKILPDVASRRKAYLISNDIAESGVSPEAIAITELPEITTPAQAMGAMYVLEGSTLGGAIIAKILDHKNITSGKTFFNAYGFENGAMWMKFLQALDGMPLNEAARSSAVRAAQQTFECFHALFRQAYG